MNLERQQNKICIMYNSLYLYEYETLLLIIKFISMQILTPVPGRFMKYNVDGNESVGAARFTLKQTPKR